MTSCLVILKNLIFNQRWFLGCYLELLFFSLHFCFFNSITSSLSFIIPNLLNITYVVALTLYNKALPILKWIQSLSPLILVCPSWQLCHSISIGHSNANSLLSPEVQRNVMEVRKCMKFMWKHCLSEIDFPIPNIHKILACMQRL
jgi:O-antigen ligase